MDVGAAAAALMTSAACGTGAKAQSGTPAPPEVSVVTIAPEAVPIHRE